MKRAFWVLLVAALGCGDDDGGVDASTDASADAVVDALVDGTLPTDTGIDAVTTDAALDTGTDVAIHFASDWSSSTGSSDEALLDGSKWCRGSGNWRNSMSVVPAPDGFPTEFVLEQRGIAESGSWGQIELTCTEGFDVPCDEAKAALPELEVGESLGMRVYWQSPNPYWDVDPGLHGFEVLDPGNDPVGINSDYRADSWMISIELPDATYADRGDDGFGAFALAPTGVYLLEMLMVRVETDRLHLEVKLTDAVTGELLYDVDEWESFHDPGLPPMHEASPFTTTGSSWRNLREWRMGINGIGDVDGQVVHRWGGFALCSGWCPPYAPGEG